MNLAILQSGWDLQRTIPRQNRARIDASLQKRRPPGGQEAGIGGVPTPGGPTVDSA
jgi:hypothetical protein